MNQSERYNLNFRLETACLEGHKEYALLMIDKGANEWNMGLASACNGGHKEIALLMIEKGANDWNWRLASACYRGHKELALLMIENGANSWNWGLLNACLKGHKDLVLLMIEKGADDWNDGLNIDDIEYLYKKGIIYFGKYTDKVKQYKKILQQVQESLDNLDSFRDIVKISMEY